MNKNTVVEFARRDEATDPLTEMLRKGARELIQQAVEAYPGWTPPHLTGIYVPKW
jgi:hypothetical protein